MNKKGKKVATKEYVGMTSGAIADPLGSLVRNTPIWDVTALIKTLSGVSQRIEVVSAAVDIDLLQYMMTANALYNLPWINSKPIFSTLRAVGSPTTVFGGTSSIYGTQDVVDQTIVNGQDVDWEETKPTPAVLKSFDEHYDTLTGAIRIKILQWHKTVNITGLCKAVLKPNSLTAGDHPSSRFMVLMRHINDATYPTGDFQYKSMITIRYRVVSNSKRVL